MSCPATVGSAASAGTAVKDPPSWARSSSSGPWSRATPTTCAPALLRAAAMPRPKPRLAPVTTAVAPDTSLSGITALPGLVGSAPLVLRPANANQPDGRESQARPTPGPRSLEASGEGCGDDRRGGRGHAAGPAP